ncbi:MAG: ATP-binding cassette domain-containing protein, partial [Eubacteriales bacterium]|nr:ATP-binding cassette domain-containing protein [Eubacteriales bacterium]
MAEDVLLRTIKLDKSYPGVRALNEVSIEVKQGEVHAIVGENGAGKSTLIKMISGADTPDSGKIIYNGKTYEKMMPHL